MSSTSLGPSRAAAAAPALIMGCLGVLAVAVLVGLPLVEVAMLTTFVALGAAFHRYVLQWRALLILLLFLILFVPVKRYILPADLPIQLEPYRILVGVLVAFWLWALLIDPRVRLRRSGLEGPIALIAIAVGGSILLNQERITQGRYVEGALDVDVAKSVSFLLSFILVFYLVVSVVRTFEEVDALLKVAIVGGTVIAVLGVIESRTGFNPFAKLSALVPFLEPNFLGETLDRGNTRAIGPAEHPIALGAVLAMLVPVGVYLWRVTRNKRWLVATAVLAMGVFTTVSRTGMLMLFVVAIVFLWLRRQEMKRLWPLALPLIVAVHFAVPGTLGTLKYAFFPPGGLIEDQRGYNDTGRVGDIAPTLDEVSRVPLFGEGYGTRIVTGPRTNARILDNQWLATLLETGAVGFFAWMWLFVRLIRRLGRVARADVSDRGWLAVALASAIAAYAAGMLTFDAMSFVQVSFVFYLFAAFSCILAVAPSARLTSGVIPSSSTGVHA